MHKALRELYPELDDLNRLIIRIRKKRSMKIQGHPIFDINFGNFCADQTEDVFGKFNLQNLIDDIISNGDFNVFSVKMIMVSTFDEIMENSFGNFPMGRLCLKISKTSLFVNISSTGVI